MDNPWKSIIIDNNKYYAEKDIDILKQIESTHPNWIKNSRSNQGEFMIGEAINGNYNNSKIILLLNNPGYSETGENEYYDTQLKYSIEKCLTLDSSAKLVYVEDDMNIYKGGYAWYTKLVHSFMRLLNMEEFETRQWMAHYVCIIEWFGYHTKEFNGIYEREDIKPLIDSLYSHRFAISLVEAAVKSNKIIISIRDHIRWIESVDGLRKHPNYYMYIGHNINAINEKTIVNLQYDDIFRYNELKKSIKSV
jgi:hypothetical protein